MLSDWWWEFWSVDPILPRTVNNIPGPTLDGTSLNLIIYFMLAMFIAGYAFYLWFRANRLDLEKLGRMSIAVLLIFWIGLEVRQSFSYFTYWSADRAQFSGKSLSQKRDLIYPPGFYSFCEFVQMRVPPSELLAVRSRVDELTSIMWNYYSLPRPVSDEAGAAYIVGMNVPPDPALKTEEFYPNWWVARK